MSELMRYAKGDERPAFRDRQVAKEAKNVYDEVRLGGLKVDGAIALAGHAMHGVVELHKLRQSLSGEDPAITAILIDIEMSAVRQIKAVQLKMFNNWNL